MRGLTQDLKQLSYDDLFQVFVNVVNWIAKEKQVEAAKDMIGAVQKEWNRRRNVGDAFTDFERSETGMLAALGYRVGQIEGRPPRARKEILKYVLEGELPMVHSASYREEWGEPKSSKRYRKVVRFLQNNIENKASCARRGHIGGVSPSRPIRQARPCSVPSACLTATTKTFAPGLMSLLSPGT